MNRAVSSSSIVHPEVRFSLPMQLHGKRSRPNYPRRSLADACRFNVKIRMQLKRLPRVVDDLRMSEGRDSSGNALTSHELASGPSLSWPHIMSLALEHIYRERITEP